MSARLASHVLAGALMRRVTAAGGTAAVLAKGEPESGAILVVCAERGEPQAVIERVLDLDRGYVWRRVAEQNPEKSDDFSTYIARRRRHDRDLWVIELDIPNAERFAAETSGDG